LWYAGNNRGWQVLKETLHFEDFKASNSNTIRKEGDGHSNVLLNQNVGNVKQKWIGIKTVVYNQPKIVSSKGGGYWPVMIETYMCNCDQDGNPQ
jgi:hypothetical protein